MADVTPEGERLIKRWLAAQDRLGRAKSEVNSADVELRNSANALSKWLLPDDAKPGEKIAVWFGDSLIQAEVPAQGGPPRDPQVTVRKRGRRLHEVA